MAQKRLLYISILGEPGVFDPETCADLPDTGDDRISTSFRLKEWGVLDKLEFVTVGLTLGEDLPNPEGIDAVIVGGSFHSVHENRDWQIKLKAWLEDWRKTGKPVLGICGGHQLMSIMDGGTVEKRPQGVKGRSAAIEVTEEGRIHPLMDGMGDNPSFHFGNFDHVTRVPDNAVVLARDDESPALALDHGGNWYSVQFHPEISHDVLQRSWVIANKPEYVENYRALPNAPRLLINFVRSAGLV